MNVLRTQNMETETYEVGDVISFQLTDGEAVKAMAVKPEDDHIIFLPNLKSAPPCGVHENQRRKLQ